MKTKRTVGTIGASLVMLLGACGSDTKTATTNAPSATAAPVADTVAPDPVVADSVAAESTEPAGTQAPETEATTGEAPSAVGPGEGELNIIVWAGYAEDGSTDPAVDWVTPFEKETGCAVNVKTGNSSDEMVQLMQTGEYDGVSASGDATTRLIEGGEVSEIDTDLVPNYADVFEGLKMKPWNSET